MLKKNGFTLVEMAIVIVIIALVTGSIIVGQSLIRVSQLRAVATEVGRYTQAVTDFRSKYLALPGDFTGAEALWGTAAGCVDADAASNPMPATATCNGNGDGRITTQGADLLANEYEQFRAWQHLANAGMIDGTYSGVAGASDPMQAIIGTSVPASKLTGAGYSLISMLSGEIGTNTVTNHYFTGINYMHMLQLGATTGIKSTLYPIISAAEALSLDGKLDDGLPSSGKVMGPQNQSAYSNKCTSANAVATTTVYCTTKTTCASYTGTPTSVPTTCSLLFLMGF